MLIRGWENRYAQKTYSGDAVHRATCAKRTMGTVRQGRVATSAPWPPSPVSSRPGSGEVGIGTPPACLDPARLTRHLGIVRRKGHLAQPALVDVLVPQRNRLGNIADSVVDTRPGVTVRGQNRRYGAHGEVARFHLSELLPRDGHGHRRTRQGSRAVGRGDRAVTVGLVEVHEDLLAAFFLPPGRGDLVRHTALQLARNPDGAVAHVQDLVRGMDPRIDVHPTVT